MDFPVSDGNIIAAESFVETTSQFNFFLYSVYFLPLPFTDVTPKRTLRNLCMLISI